MAYVTIESIQHHYLIKERSRLAKVSNDEMMTSSIDNFSADVKPSTGPEAAERLSIRAVSI